MESGKSNFNPTKMNDGEIDGAGTGSFTVTGNVGLLTLTLIAGDGTENNQFNVNIRQGSTTGDAFSFNFS